MRREFPSWSGEQEGWEGQMANLGPHVLRGAESRYDYGWGCSETRYVICNVSQATATQKWEEGWSWIIPVRRGFLGKYSKNTNSILRRLLVRK